MAVPDRGGSFLLDKLHGLRYNCVIIKFDARKGEAAMARETQKEKIARLEAENEGLKQQLAEYHKAWIEADRQKQASVMESDEYRSIEKRLEAETINTAEAQRLYKRESEKREQLRQDYVTLKESYDALVTSYNALESDFKRVCEELQQAPMKEPHNARGAGRKPKITQEQRETAFKMHSEGMSSRKIANAIGLSYSTVLRIIRSK